jgi:hypothetical protein|tara:strand:- start:4665 stop:5468 length:804 start_codon:yes stop_codon:yes gene_type:complete
MTGMNVFCLGMKRSASTWQYNAARYIIERSTRHEFDRPTTIDEADLQEMHRLFTPRFVKVHNIPHDMSRRLLETDDAFLYIHRDIRDVTASWKQFTGETGAALRVSMQAVVGNHVRMMYWLGGSDHYQLLHQKYEDMMENPGAELERIAAFLQPFLPGYMPPVAPIPEKGATRLVEELGIAQVQRAMSGLRFRDGGVVIDTRPYDYRRNHDAYDRETKYYGNHISPWEGKVGIWDEVLEGEDRQTAIEMYEQASERIAASELGTETA